MAILSLFSCILTAGAAWYWPFGDDDGKKDEPRLSELTEPASRLIDAASDYAEEGKVDEAIAEYNKALGELARIELENPERATRPEFATVRNKRAYIESAIDSLLMRQAKQNAKAVAVTDTTALERKFAEERAARASAKANRGKTSSDRGRKPARGRPAAGASDDSDIDAALSPSIDAAMPSFVLRPPDAASAKADRRARMLRAREALLRKDHAAALAALADLLKENPDDAPALNLRAMVEKDRGDAKAAEATLTQLIQANPRAHYGFYNLAKLILETQGEAGKEQARRYYRNGREFAGGPVDAFLEERLK